MMIFFREELKKKIKKTDNKIIILFIIILMISTHVYADDYDIEEYNEENQYINEINLQEIEEASNNKLNIPTINSRRAVI